MGHPAGGCDPEEHYLMFGARILVSRFWPRVRKGNRTIRLRAHPIICWLAHWLPIEPWIDITVPVWADADPVFDARHNVLHCSEAQAAALRQTVNQS